MARDGEHFVMQYLSIGISSFEKVLFSFVAHFYIESLIFWEFGFYAVLGLELSAITLNHSTSLIL
jgi:hypothetical protein